MKKRFFAAVAALALVAVFAAPAAAGKKIDTKVTIKGNEGNYYGYVKSSNEKKCANGREVIVYKLKGNGYDPRNDKEIGSDIAQANQDGYMWNIGDSGAKKGNFYAYTPKTKKCKKAFSKVISR